MAPSSQSVVLNHCQPTASAPSVSHQRRWTVRPRRRRRQGSHSSASVAAAAAAATWAVASLCGSLHAYGFIIHPAELASSCMITASRPARERQSATTLCGNRNFAASFNCNTTGQRMSCTALLPRLAQYAAAREHSSSWRSSPFSSLSVFEGRFIPRRQCLSRRHAVTATIEDAPITLFSSSVRPLDDEDLTPAPATRDGSNRTPPSTVELSPGDAIEIWHEKGIVFANYEGPVPERRSLLVRLASGESLAIDAGQIVGVWDAERMDGGGALPSTREEWSALKEGMRALVQSIPSRGLDLAPFWKAASSREKGFIVTPADAAEFLFSEEYRSVGLKKRKRFEFRSPGGSFQPTAVQRAMAAQLLAGELTRFKRVVSERADKKQTPPSSLLPSSQEQQLQPVGVEIDKIEEAKPYESQGASIDITSDGMQQQQQAMLLTEDHDAIGDDGGSNDGMKGSPTATATASDGVLVRLGGFKAVDQSVAVTREVADFCQVVNAIKNKKANTKTALPSADEREALGEEEGEESREGSVASQGALARAGLFEPTFLLILHSLEAYAIGGDENSLAPEAKRVLETLGKAGQTTVVSPAAAKSVLVDVGLWTRKSSLSSGVADVNGGGINDDHVDGNTNGDRDSLQIEAGRTDGVAPWPAEVLSAASAVGKERARRWQNYHKREPDVDVGAPAPFGRYDFRGAEFGVYCIDGEGTTFLDDAFSIDPKTREVFIHITDVQSLVTQGSTLDEVARLRAASEYLPQGPLFMMPPTALKAISFSDRGPNEAITVGVKLDPKTGRIVSSRVMLTTLPPVVALTFSQVDRLLEEGDAERGDGGRRSRVTAELKALEYVSRRSAEASGRRHRSREGLQLRSAGRGGQVQATEVPKSRALSLVDELLTVYTLKVYGLCQEASVAMPTLVGQQDLVAAGRSRYGTGPLRRYIDILAQRQVAAILRGTGYLTKKYLLATASYLTWRHNETRSRRQEESGRLSLEALASHCRTQMKATGMTHAVVPARGTGQGREVRLDGLGVTVHVKRAPGRGGRGVAIAKGEPVKVVIERVEPQLKQVVATEYADE